MKISAVVLTKNEEWNIEKCIGSLAFCDEIIVVDDYSLDKTIAIVESLRSRIKSLKIQTRDLKSDFAEQRNYAMKMASNDWVFFVDADEEITNELKKEINRNFQRSIINSQAYYIKRRDYWWGKELRFGETQKVKNKGIIRLVKKGSGEWMGNVHEVFFTSKSTGTLGGFINHHPHPTVKEFLHDINVYSSLRAEELYNHGRSTNILEIVFYPFFKFILNYCIYLGFLDGPAGFAYAFLMSFHSFLVRSKLYQYRHLNQKSK